MPLRGAVGRVYRQRSFPLPLMSPAGPTISSHLLEQETSFQLLFFSNPVPMYVFDNETLAILAVNDAAVEKYGWTRAEFARMTIENLRPPEEVTALRAYRAVHAKDPAMGLNQTVTWRHWTKDGRILEMETTWIELPWDERTAVITACVDRSELKHAEERAREQARLLDLAADAIFVRDLQRRTLFWNQGAERLYGWTRAEMLGRCLPDFTKVDTAKFAAAERELMVRGYWNGQLEGQCKEGRKVIVNSRWTLVRDDRGQPKSVLVINTDLTETKKLESQFLRAQRLEAIGTLASGIAHDLNNILAPILMSVGILRDLLPEDGEEAKLLNIIESSADRGAGIVKQVLTFARGVEGERVLLQPRHLVSELTKIMAQTFPRNIDLQTYFSPDLRTVTGDATQIHQVLLNLCVNARDAMPKGGQLTVTAENAEVDEHFAKMNPGAQLGPHVVFRVTDAGSGMPPETLEKIFDPFFTTKEVGKGTGLGLATVVGIVKSHGGFLNVLSEVGVGTTFKIFLPAAQEAGVKAATVEAGPVAGGSGQLVLVVDDEITIREAVVRTLQANGYRAYTAEDGTDALALYFQRREEIEVVLTDIAMGQMDGITLVRSLRKLNPAVRVIVSSGHFQKESLAVLEGLGVQVFLEKPYPAEKLLRALTTVLATPGEAKK